MHEFCPLCTKNGIQAKIRSYQLNFTEAVFMCENVQCIWPAGYQELTFMHRPIGQSWSSTWGEAASKYWKSLLYPVKNSSASSSQSSGSAMVCKESIFDPVEESSVSTLPETSASCTPPSPLPFDEELPVDVPEEKLPTVLLDFSSHKFSTDCEIDESASNGKNLLPEPVNSKDFVHKTTQKSNVFTIGDKNICKDSVKFIQIESNVSEIDATLIDKKPIVKHEQIIDNSSLICEKVGKVLREIKCSNKKKPKIIPCKFDFEDLKKSKSTNVEKEDNLDLGKNENKKVLLSVKKESSSNSLPSLADKPIVTKSVQNFEELSKKSIASNISCVRSKLFNKKRIKPLDFNEIYTNKSKNIDETLKLELVKVEEKLCIEESMLVDRHDFIESNERSVVDKIYNSDTIQKSFLSIEQMDVKNESSSDVSNSSSSTRSVLTNKRRLKPFDFDDIFMAKIKKVEEIVELQSVESIKIDSNDTVEKLSEKSVCIDRRESTDTIAWSEASTIINRRDSRESDELLTVADSRESLEKSFFAGQNNTYDAVDSSRRPSSEDSSIVERSTTDDDYLDLDIDVDFDSLSPNSDADPSMSSGLRSSSKDSGVGQDDEVMFNCNDLQSLYDCNNVNSQDASNCVTTYNESTFDDILESIDLHAKPTSTEEFLDALLEGDL